MAIQNTAQTQLTADLASTASGKGASLIGIEDSAGDITATTVEGALAELAAADGGGGIIALATNSDQLITDTSLSNVTSLTRDISDGDKVHWQACLHYTSSIAGEELKVAANGPTASTLIYAAHIIGGTGTVGDSESKEAWDSEVFYSQGTTAIMPAYIEGYFVATADGTFAIRASTATGSGESNTIQKGSTLKLIIN